MGGTLFRMAPYAVGALVGLRQNLPRMGEYVAWARALAAELVALGLTVEPEPPQTNTFLVHVATPAEAVNERLADLMERTKVRLAGPFRDAAVPGWATTELAIQAAALEHAPARVADWWAELLPTAALQRS